MLERDGPLLALAVRLRSLGPPSVSALITCLGEMQEYQSFRRLVREFLPERKGEVLGRPDPVSQVAAFADYFEDRYFPLHPSLKDGMGEGYSDLTDRIPALVLGCSWDDYHDLDLRPGLLLMTYLLEDPWEGDAEGRVPLGEACAEHVPAALLRRVPEGGLARAEAHCFLDGTLYEALALWADVLAHDTGNPFLDACMEDVWEEDLPWERETVEHLAREWPQAERLQRKYFELVEMLEEDLTAQLGKLLDFIEQKRAEVNSDAGDGAPGFAVGVAGSPANTP